MLIEKKEVVAANDVISFRLTTGDELMAKLVDSDESSITVSKPVVVQMRMISPTEAGLGFAPFMVSANEETARFRFERSKLVTDPLKTRKDITAQYVQMTTGLAVPNAPSLLKP